MRWIILIHRWLGVGLCLLFSAWFLSGMVMIFQPYPSLGESERLSRSELIVFSNEMLPITKHLSLINEHSTKATLISVLGELYYWWENEGKDRITVVHAVTGLTPQFDINQIRKIANQYYPDKKIESIRAAIEYDQWIVSNRFDPFRPFYRVDYDDSANTSIYVSSRNGQVLQETNQKQRAWNYIGSVIHWIYPTVIRKNWTLWDQLVWWLALAGIVSAITGITLGVIKSIRAQRGWSEYSGWLYWHHLGGLIIGLLVLSWIFSGWLSMDHGRIFSTPEPTIMQMRAFNGGALDIDAQQIAGLGSVISPFTNEIEFRVIADIPFLLSKSSKEKMQTWLLNSEGSWQLQENGLPRHLIQKAIYSAWPNSEIIDLEKISSNDIYAHLREGNLPPSALRVVLSDDQKIWIHVDKYSGDIISVMDSGRRLYRWLFNGLHSFDFPGLISRPILWYCVILTFLGLGFLFSTTGVILGVRRLLR